MGFDSTPGQFDECPGDSDLFYGDDMGSSYGYKPKKFELSGLNGISDQTLETHFKLYEGYVKETNHITSKITDLVEKGDMTPDKHLIFSELKRHLSFEYNGMVLHEYYFDNLTSNGNDSPSKDSAFFKRVQKDFGSYDLWKTSFVNTGKMRGIGWAIAYEDPTTKHISNQWVTLHEAGNIAGYKPILVMDVWEHAFILDFKPAEKEKYIEAFFSNIDWKKVDSRLS